ncbi:sensor histidine kinase [Persicobacter diffluens]|uniref:histidine kinase n=1 Tax=Persicobacter diffluens TaxID=981 RepID=A0AAN4VWF9_9BACT|nr:hypothetical protein PEDI_19160 [Persicobacter diffluens]
MDNTGKTELFTIILIVVIGMFFISSSLVVFFIIYQRRLYESKEIIQRLEKEHQKELHEHSVAAQESEQERIAKDLHDEVGAMLSTSRLYINQIIDLVNDQNTTQLAVQTKEILSNTITSVRRISQNLKPVALEKFGLHEAIISFLKPVDENEIKTKLDFQCNAKISEDQEISVFRILQELTNNTVKHAKASKIEIKIQINSSFVHLEFKDNGIGMDFNRINGKSKGLGLKSIESRISLLEGNIIFKNISPSGLMAQISFPLDTEKTLHKSH